MTIRKLLAVPTAGALAIGLYRYRYHFISRYMGLPKPNYKVGAERNIRVVMLDSITLATDHYFPKGLGKAPAILIRTPYGRGGFMGIVNVLRAQQMAACGYHVICQDVRGRFDSEGRFEPFIHEMKDGQATIEWIISRPWSNGVVGLWGQSYSGFASWAAAISSHPAVKAMLPSVTSSNITPVHMEGFPLDLTLRWLLVIETMADIDLPLRKRLSRITRTKVQDSLLAPGFKHLPLSTADEIIFDKPKPIYDTWRQHADPDDPYWTAAVLSDRVENVKAPVHLVSGWFDVFLAQLLADYDKLRIAGRKPYLTIGPWRHHSRECGLESLRQGFLWFEAHLLGRRQALRPYPVRVYLMGADEWLEMDSWPPQATPRPFYLNEDGWLSTNTPVNETTVDAFRYDPADPTPGIGGALLSYSAGAVDNRALETRPDVFTYTTRPLDRIMDVVGPVSARVYVKSSREYTNFFARLCDVYPDGKSLNVCDGLYNYLPERGETQPDGSRYIDIKMTPTAQRFKAGHRIRLQISSGAHPRYARTLGTDESNFTGVRMCPADQQLLHGKTQPSALFLPVRD